MLNRVIIIGAGVSGLSSAWRLSKKGIKAAIIESSPEIGGSAGTHHYKDYHLDIGPHSFFSEQQQIVETILDLFDHKLIPQPRNVKFYYNGRFLDYPLSARGVLLQMGIRSSIGALLSFLKTKCFPLKKNKMSGAKDQTVEEWAIAGFGEHLYHTFFKPYTEQFWKIPCAELSSRSIPTHTRMNFMNTLKVLLHYKGLEKKKSLVEREMLPTYYPKTGFVEIAERIAEQIRGHDGKIYHNSKAVGIKEHTDGTVTVAYEHNHERKEIIGDHVISTIPLPDLMRILSPAPPDNIRISAEKLNYQGLVVLGMITNKQDILNCGYIYVLNRPFNRIYEMNKFSPHTSPQGENILAVELTCQVNSFIWNASKEQLFDICISDLAKDGFIQPGDVKDLIHIKTPAAYPIYRYNYETHLNRVFDHLKNYGSLTTLGRCGEFMYMDIDRCIEKGFTCADDLTNENNKM